MKKDELLRLLFPKLYWWRLNRSIKATAKVVKSFLPNVTWGLTWQKKKKTSPDTKS